MLLIIASSYLCKKEFGTLKRGRLVPLIRYYITPSRTRQLLLTRDTRFARHKIKSLALLKNIISGDRIATLAALKRRSAFHQTIITEVAFTYNRHNTEMQVYAYKSGQVQQLPDITVLFLPNSKPSVQYKTGHTYVYFGQVGKMNIDSIQLR